MEQDYGSTVGGRNEPEEGGEVSRHGEQQRAQDDDDEASTLLRGGRRQEQQHQHHRLGTTGPSSFLQSLRRRLAAAPTTAAASSSSSSSLVAAAAAPPVPDSGTAADDGGPPPPPNYYSLYFWMSILILSYATERCTFKVVVDRAGPFRLLIAETIAGCHAVILALIVLILPLIRTLVRRKRSGTGGVGGGSSVQRGEEASHSLDMKGLANLPLIDLGLVAVLDSIQLILSVISASHVPAVLTVMLVQLTIPLTVCFTQCDPQKNGACSAGSSEDDDDDSVEAEDAGGRRPPPRGDDGTSLGLGGFTARHVCGATVVALALVLGMCPSLLRLIDPGTIPERSMSTQMSWNTVLYATSTIPAAASTVLKDRALYKYRQPIDMNQLNLILTAVQFVFVAVVSPLFYSLQGLAMHSGWVGEYPSRDISVNFMDGLSCFVGMLDGRAAEDRYPEPARCGVGVAGLVLGHVVSIVLVGSAVSCVVVNSPEQARTRLAYRCIGAAIVLAVIIMYTYDEAVVGQEYGSKVKGFFWSCLVVLVIGFEIYHGSGLPDETFETVYPEVESMQDDE